MAGAAAGKRGEWFTPRASPEPSRAWTEGWPVPNHTAMRERAENRRKSGGLLELYEDKEPPHHEAERGRAENHELNFSKKSGFIPGN